ncbi:MAG: YqaE/Pmp3 family membrane protein [Pseudomonadota bacterium]
MEVLYLIVGVVVGALLNTGIRRGLIPSGFDALNYIPAISMMPIGVFLVIQKYRSGSVSELWLAIFLALLGWVVGIKYLVGK